MSLQDIHENAGWVDAYQTDMVGLAGGSTHPTVITAMFFG
jgi:hypothetical protein